MDMTVAEGLALYKAKVSILKKGYAQEKYRIDQISRDSLGALVTRDVTSVDIATYRDKRLEAINPRTGKHLSTATVRLEMSLLSNYFDLGRIEWGICDSNPVSNVRKPKPAPGRERRITAREERKILRYAHAHPNPELYSIIVLALETAARQGELLRLTWENINLTNRIAHLPKTKNGSPRDIPLSLKARDALIRLGVKSNGRVFGYTSNGLKSTWRFMMDKLGIENLHFHDARHECISRLFEMGTLDMMEIAAISGHKSLSMLKRYTHLKAAKLVKKLEGPRSKSRQAVINLLVPYPAAIRPLDAQIEVRLLDFENLVSRAPTISAAIEGARDALLRRLLLMMRCSEPIPAPDQYLEEPTNAEVIMLDPLPLTPMEEELSAHWAH